MDRRSFLQTSLAGFVGAPAAFRGRHGEVRAEPKPAPSGPTFIRDKVFTSRYVFEKGVLYVDEDHKTGCPFDTLFLNVNTGRLRCGEVVLPGRTEVHGGFKRLTAPSGLMKKLIKKYGDVMQANSNTLKVGLEREDGGTFYFSIPKVVLTEFGCRVSAQETSVCERTRFLGCERPREYDSGVELYEALVTTRLKGDYLGFTSVDLEKALKDFYESPA